MYILLMSAGWNTILSGIIGFVIGAVVIAFWYGHEEYKEMGGEFDEADIYDIHPYDRPTVKKIKS